MDSTILFLLSLCNLITLACNLYIIKKLSKLLKKDINGHALIDRILRDLYD